MAVAVLVTVGVGVGLEVEVAVDVKVEVGVAARIATVAPVNGNPLNCVAPVTFVPVAPVKLAV